MTRQTIKDKKRWIIKVGSAILTNDGRGLNTDSIDALAKQIAHLREQGVEIILVSSGSIAAGVNRLNIDRKTSKISDLQAAAAVGQASLIRAYESAFEQYSITIAQVLLTHADVANRDRYLNARKALSRLLELDILTVINENDTVATDEICFGDNDTLASLVANLVDAQLLIILTDQQGLFTADPRKHDDATLISEDDADNESLMQMASGGSFLGRGGMVTKISAAQNASRSGASTLIADGCETDVLIRLYQGEELGTLLNAGEQRLASKKQWMAGQMRIKGTIIIDDGAAKVLLQLGKSLLPVGVLTTQGDFKRGELVSCINQQGDEIARGLSNYNAVEVDLIKGMSSEKISAIIKYGDDDEVIHRDNLVLV